MPPHGRDRPLMRMLHHVSRRHFQHIHTALHEYDVYPGQPPLMFALARKNGQSQKELAEQLDIKAATLTVMINRMEKNGMVRRETDEKDQRVTRIYLTERGVETLEVVRETLDRLEQQAIAGLSEEEIETLHSLLGRIKHNIRSMSVAGSRSSEASAIRKEEDIEVQDD